MTGTELHGVTANTGLVADDLMDDFLPKQELGNDLGFVCLLSSHFLDGESLLTKLDFDTP